MAKLTAKQKKELRADLERQLAKLEASMAVTDEALKTVELDQTAVGRLSRMDSLLSQGIAQGLREREAQTLAAIVKALKRLEQGTYGLCLECSAPIPFPRLQVFPESETCTACAVS